MSHLNLKPPIRRVFLDLGNVLFYLKPALTWERVLLHSQLTQCELAGRFFQSGLKILYETGQMGCEDFFEQLRELLDYEADSPALIADWNAMLPPINENIRFARELAANIPTGVISNTNTAHIESVLAVEDFSRYCSPCIYSHEVGYLKPREEIYHAALARIEEPAEACVFIDDRPDNVQGAQAVGMHAYTFPPAGCLQTFWENTVLPAHACPAN